MTDFQNDIRLGLPTKVVEHFDKKMVFKEFCETKDTFVWVDHCVVLIVDGWNIRLSYGSPPS